MKTPNEHARLILVRHGRTAHNRERRVQGHIDAPLDDLGQEQARKLARHLHVLGVREPRIHSSDLSRAHATAQALQAELGGTLSTHLELREIFMGDWEGQLYDALALSDAELHRQFWSGDPHCTARNGECPAQVAQRVHAHALAHWPAPGETLILVSHGIAIIGLLCELLGLNYQTEFRSGALMHANTAYSVLDIHPQTKAILNAELARADHLT